ncbi:aldehyde ferredoxin oxidoreductase family protein [Natronomonas sp. EA1]|uniref:aldehyde ferredoxin oxidoreductase family protein n=1 Tax=Natronomonas sp. EA1 TaxID=3421655 RepID=UPI003EBABD05
MTRTAPDRLLRADLSARTVESEPVPEAWRRRYLGGKGLGARYLYEELSPGTDPLAPANVLAFMLGPVSGLLPGEARYAAVTKSPLTGTFLDSYAGGEFPLMLAGALGPHLGLLVTGQADEPVRLVVEDGEASIEAATEWGADAASTCRAHEGAVACIGPAGEHGVAYATIASDDAEHHAGRGGAGAVMGAKRLKAVVARGEPPSGFESLREEYERRYREDHTGRWHAASGTLETVDFAQQTGVLAARGFAERGFEGAGAVGIEAVRAAASDREHDGAIPGGFRVETGAGESVPRGATAMTLGAGLAIDDFDAVAELGEQCNRLGMDLISAGNAVAWAARASDADVLDRPVAFGDPEGARTLLAEIATRESALGDALADGVDAATDRFGGEAFAATVKGMELPAYDPRGAASMALAYATSDRGGCHRRARPVEREVFDGPWDPETAADAVADAQDTRSVRWSLVADDFTGETLTDDGAEWLEAVGAPHDDLATVGERVWTLVRLFNVREGFTRADDCLPAAIDPEDLPADFDALLEAYYDRRGWDERGVPTAATRERLDLQEL